MKLICKSRPIDYLEQFICQVQLNVRSDDDRVEVGRDDDKQNCCHLFSIQNRKLDRNKDEQCQDGGQVDDHPGNEEKLGPFCAAVDQPYVNEYLNIK
jgi:hypothetical protein